MLFGKRDKKNQSNERVLNLKARVDALRQADEASRQKTEAHSLEQFLEGDDVLTGREVEDTYTPTDTSTDKGSSAEPDEDDETNSSVQFGGSYDGIEVDLEAELQKYLRRQEEQARNPDRGSLAAPESASRAEHEDRSTLDGTQSRDDVSSPMTPAQDGAAWPDNPDSAWPGSWPAEEDWPPREKAV